MQKAKKQSRKLKRSCSQHMNKEKKKKFRSRRKT